MKSKLRIKKDDKVMVIAGRDQGKVGKVLKINTEKLTALVEKVNMIKRHSKGGGKTQGGIVEKEAPIHVSNLQVMCGKCNQAARLGTRELEDGRRARFCKKCGEILEG
ncbi:MAG: 50S ribosomal protein L24 [Deltaproteobacteria bacterium]|nr:50S ribosomal protein L24 [Deltaproteobacteria bacterium]